MRLAGVTGGTAKNLFEYAGRKPGGRPEGPPHKAGLKI
jgi:hypothetical protein